MKETVVAGRYSRALLLVLQEEKLVSFPTVHKQLGEIVRILDVNEKVKLVFQSSMVSVENKKKLLREIMNLAFDECSSILLNFMDIVILKKRLNLLPLILLKFEQMMEESKGELKACVKSATVLSEGAKNELERKLSQRFNKKIIIESSVSPELLAGVVVKTDNTILDNSLRMQLKNVKKILSE